MDSFEPEKLKTRVTEACYQSVTLLWPLLKDNTNIPSTYNLSVMDGYCSYAWYALQLPLTTAYLNLDWDGSYEFIVYYDGLSMKTKEITFNSSTNPSVVISNLEELLASPEAYIEKSIGNESNSCDSNVNEPFVKMIFNESTLVVPTVVMASHSTMVSDMLSDVATIPNQIIFDEITTTMGEEIWFYYVDFTRNRFNLNTLNKEEQEQLRTLIQYYGLVIDPKISTEYLSRTSTVVALPFHHPSKLIRHLMIRSDKDNESELQAIIDKFFDNINLSYKCGDEKIMVTIEHILEWLVNALDFWKLVYPDKYSFVYNILSEYLHRVYGIFQDPYRRKGTWPLSQTDVEAKFIRTLAQSPSEGDQVSSNALMIKLYSSDPPIIRESMCQYIKYILPISTVGSGSNYHYDGYRQYICDLPMSIVITLKDVVAIKNQQFNLDHYEQLIIDFNKAFNVYHKRNNYSFHIRYKSTNKLKKSLLSKEIAESEIEKKLEMLSFDEWTRDDNNQRVIFDCDIRIDHIYVGCDSRDFISYNSVDHNIRLIVTIKTQ